jgi:hypothetical protein
MPSRLATPACGTGGSRTLILARKRRLLCQSSFGPMCVDGVRIELTMLASERRGYGPLDHRWSHPVLVRRVPLLPDARRSPLLSALSENDEPRAGGGNRTRFSGKASRCPTNGRHPRVHCWNALNLPERIALAGPRQTQRGRGAFATRPREGLLRGERSGSAWHSKAQGAQLVLATLGAAIADLVDAKTRARRRDHRVRFGVPLRGVRD